MKRMSFRMAAALLALVMTVGLCACGVDATPTTTTAGDATTTTVADEVTTTVVDDATTTEGDEVTTTVNDDKPATQGGTKVTTTKKVTTTTKDLWANNPWDGATKPAPTTTTTVEGTYETLAPVIREEKHQNEHGIYHILKGYCYGKVYKASEWLPIIGYVKDGEVVDAMFTATTIMPDPGNVHYGSLDTKREWDQWVQHTFKNLDNLNEAAEQVRTALNLKEYKIKVFPSLFNPTKMGGNTSGGWGKLDGEEMIANNRDHSYQMLTYLMDSYMTEFAAREYKNLELYGFYWFDESLSSGVEDLPWYNRVTDYARSKGKITIVSPYYKAGGWHLCDEAGFDLHSMQANYFPNSKVGSLNCGTDRRLPAIAEIITKGEIGGLEVEMTGTDQDCITGLKKYLKTGVENGFMGGYHIHYLSQGVSAVYTLSKSRDEYIRSAYDDLYKYMHNALTVEDMEIRPIIKEQEWQDGAIDWV